ncbi:MAG: c-type cytochrome domain-containing protein [Limisphaerales bacterium]
MNKITSNQQNGPLLRLGLAVLAMLVVGQTGRAADALRVLQENCMRCHGAEKRKGGLAMNTRPALFKGGDTGDVINLEKPGDSLLLELLQPDADPHMPPKKQLTEAEISAVADWIKAGAQWDLAALNTLPATRELKWQPLPGRYRPIAGLAVSPDGKRLAVGRGTNLDLYDLGEKNATNKTTLKAGLDAVQSVTWHPTGESVVSGGFRRAAVWDAKTREKMKVIRTGLVGRITAMKFVNDGKHLVLAESVPTVLGRLIVVETKRWKTVKTVRAHVDAIYNLSLSPDGKYLSSSSADKLAHLWRVADWKKHGTLEGHTDYVMGSAFNPGGDRIATVSSDSTVKVWEVQTQKQISTFSDRNSKMPINDIHWTLNPADKKPKQDADWIITVSEDAKPRLYTNLVLHDGAQRSTGAKMRAWSPGAMGLTALTFSPTMNQVIAGDLHGGVTIWDINGKVVKQIQ